MRSFVERLLNRNPGVEISETYGSAVRHRTKKQRHTV